MKVIIIIIVFFFLKKSIIVDGEAIHQVQQNEQFFVVMQRLRCPFKSCSLCLATADGLFLLLSLFVS